MSESTPKSTPQTCLIGLIEGVDKAAASWLVFAVFNLGIALARAGQQVWLLYVWYGLYYGMAYRTIIAKVADLVLETLSGVTLGTFNPAIDLFGISDLG